MSDARDVSAPGPPDGSEPTAPDAASPARGGGPRVEVLGGRPTHEELAALVVALQPPRAGRAREPGGPGAGGASRAAWQRAARLEGAGAARVGTAADLEQAGRPQPTWP